MKLSVLLAQKKSLLRPERLELPLLKLFLMKKFIQWNWHLGLNADYMGNIKNSDISLWLKNRFLSNCGGNICREVEEFIITLTDSSHSSLPIICYEGRTIQADNHQPSTTNQFICITGIGNHFHGCFCMKSAIFPCHHPAVIHHPSSYLQPLFNNVFYR